MDITGLDGEFESLIRRNDTQELPKVVRRVASRDAGDENGGAMSSQQARPRAGAQTEADWSAESRGRIPSSPPTRVSSRMLGKSSTLVAST